MTDVGTDNLPEPHPSYYMDEASPPFDTKQSEGVIQSLPAHGFGVAGGGMLATSTRESPDSSLNVPCGHIVEASLQTPDEGHIQAS